MNREEQYQFLSKIADVLLWCLIFSIAFLWIWWIFYFIGGHWAYSIHSPLFGLTKHEFDLIMYGGMGILKILAILFFLFPWLAIKIVLRKKEK